MFSCRLILFHDRTTRKITLAETRSLWTWEMVPDTQSMMTLRNWGNCANYSGDTMDPSGVHSEEHCATDYAISIHNLKKITLWLNLSVWWKIWAQLSKMSRNKEAVSHPTCDVMLWNARKKDASFYVVTPVDIIFSHSLWRIQPNRASTTFFDKKLNASTCSSWPFMQSARCSSGSLSS